MPPIGSRGILARVDLVKRVYAELQKPSTNAIVLTGLIGSGKSILAELIYHFAEEQRRTYKTFFTAEALWIEFKFTSRSNLSDMAELIFKAVGKRIPDFKNLDVDKQVAELYKALEKRFMLIVLDQFDILLDWQTGSILEECQGMSEWLREINSRQCKCKMLITGCSMWSGIEGLPKGYIHQHDVSELESNEAIKLLQDQNIQGTKEEMDAAVKIFNNHPKALRLLGEYLNSTLYIVSSVTDSPGKAIEDQTGD